MFAKPQWDTEARLPKHMPLIPLFHGKDGFWQVFWTESPLRTVTLNIANTSQGRQPDRLEHP